MTGLLTAAAVITTLMLLASASNAGSRATASDPHKRGSWGIAHWQSQRSRSLDPHQRRWQTALLSSRETDTRWKDLVAEIQGLEHLAGTEGVGAAPAKFDRRWIEASVANLEASVPDSTTTGDNAR